jgi:hypothetical protein
MHYSEIRRKPVAISGELASTVTRRECTRFTTILPLFSFLLKWDFSVQISFQHVFKTEDTEPKPETCFLRLGLIISTKRRRVESLCTITTRHRSQVTAGTFATSSSVTIGATNHRSPAVSLNPGIACKAPNFTEHSISKEAISRLDSRCIYIYNSL